jgi:hypothetical protein
VSKKTPFLALYRTQSTQTDTHLINLSFGGSVPWTSTKSLHLWVLKNFYPYPMKSRKIPNVTQNWVNFGPGVLCRQCKYCEMFPRKWSVIVLSTTRHRNFALGVSFIFCLLPLSKGQKSNFGKSRRVTYQITRTDELSPNLLTKTLYYHSDGSCALQSPSGTSECFFRPHQALKRREASVMARKGLRTVRHDQNHQRINVYG